MTKPTLESDRRGVSEVIGAILVFGLVVMLVSLLQVQAIPNANQEVEFEHSQQVRGDFADLQVAVDRAVTSGQSQSASIRMGVDYPARLLFFNPPSRSGALRTTESDTIHISNVRSSTDAGTFFDEMSNDVEYDTRSLVYSIGYNELQNSPADVREPAATYRLEDDVALVSDTTLVDGKDINLVAIGGELDAGGTTAQKIQAKALSAPTRTYTVRDTSGSGTPLTIRVPTDLDQEEWRDLLADEMGPDGHVESATVSGGVLTVELEEDVQYTLRMAKIGFGQGGGTEPAYIVPVSTEAGNEAGVEVRDKFNNPVDGVTVNVEFQDADGNALASRAVTTGADGQASVERPNSGAGSEAVQVEFSKQFDNDPAFSKLEKVTAYFINDVVLTDATGGSVSDVVEFELRNPGAEQSVESVQVHHVTQYQGIEITGVGAGPIGATNVADGPNAVTRLEVTQGGAITTFNSNPTENGEPQTPDSPFSIPSGTHTMKVTFDQPYSFNTGLSNDALEVRLTLYFEDGSQGTYDVMLQAGDDR